MGDAFASMARALDRRGNGTRAQVAMLVAFMYYARGQGRFFGIAGLAGETWRGEWRSPGDDHHWEKI
ncbi:MAG: hypothetical protein KGL39_07765 [Patescibacteria group bacterium]|nr:hypothetical protein [Patescibacteria group bacterium]